MIDFFDVMRFLGSFSSDKNQKIWKRGRGCNSLIQKNKCIEKNSKVFIGRPTCGTDDHCRTIVSKCVSDSVMMNHFTRHQCHFQRVCVMFPRNQLHTTSDDEERMIALTSLQSFNCSERL